MMPLPDTFQYVSEEENNYHESSDEDFNPATLAAEASSSSEDDDRAEPSGLDTAPRKRKRKVLSPIELDSGDERTIEAAKKRKARKKDGGDDGDTGLLFSDDEGGEGGLIKTRAQRRVEYVLYQILYVFLMLTRIVGRKSESLWRILKARQWMLMPFGNRCSLCLCNQYSPSCPQRRRKRWLESKMVFLQHTTTIHPRITRMTW